MIISRARIATSLAAVMMLAACATPAGTPEASASGDASSRPPFETVAASASAELAVDRPESIPQAAWTAILDDLAGRVDEPVLDATVLNAEPMTWNDGSLGCPVPGQAYTQALVDGFHVIVEVDGEEFDYRIGGGEDVRLCEA